MFPWKNIYLIPHLIWTYVQLFNLFQAPSDETRNSPPGHSPIGASPQHMMSQMAENPMDAYNYNNVSPQHATSPPHNISPQHVTSPHVSPQHITSPMHVSSPHMPSPQHMVSPQHMPSPQHISSPQHMASPQHVSSPQHIPSPQHPGSFTFNNGHQPSPLAAGMGGYNSIGGDHHMLEEPAIEQQLQPTVSKHEVILNSITSIT